MTPARPAARRAARRAGGRAAAAALAVGLAAAWALAQAEPPPAAPDAPRLAFETLTARDGLPADAVAAVVQDALGFVWAGTSAGLVRLDGVEVRRVGADARGALPSPVVTALAAGPGGEVWVGTADGLARVDPAREVPATVAGLPAADVLAVDADAAGAWVGTSAGAARVERPAAEGAAAGAAARVAQTVPAARLPHPEVQAVLADGAAAWLGTGDGLVRADARGVGRVLRPPGLAPASVSALARLAPGRLAVGTLGGGAFTLDERTGAFTPLPLGGGPAAALVSSLRVDAEGALWVGTLGGGLRRLVPAPGGYALAGVYGADAGLPATEVAALFDDRQGVLWAATVAGLARADRARGRPLRLRPERAVAAVLADTAGTLWLGTDAGLERSADGGRTAERAPGPDAPVTALALDARGRVLAGTARGEVARGADGLARVGAPVAALLADGEAVWAATLGRGLVRLDGGRATRAAGLPGDSVRALARDARGALWAATPGGLCRQQAAGFACRAGLDALALHADTRGALWAGTAAGLARVPPDAPPETVPGVAGPVLGLASDGAGFLWLATPAGLFRFDPVTRTAAPVVPGAALAGPLAPLPDGRLAAASPRGALVLDARGGPRNPHPPQVALTGVSVGNVPVEPGPDAPLAAAAPVADALRLGPDQDYVTFHFAALHFADPARNTVRYRLEGFDEDWREGGTRREATYTNLDPGRYTFRVEATSADGVGGGPGAALAVVVRAPWWRTPWALLGGAALLGVLLVLADRRQRARLLRRERERAARREAELRAEAAEAARREATAEAERRRAEAEQQRAEAALLQADNDRKAAELDRARSAEDANARLAAANRRLEASLADLKATQDQLIRQEKLASLGQLTAGVAHEIKNPLNFVSGFAALSVDLADDLAAQLAAAADRPVADVLPDVQDLLDDLRANAGRIQEHSRRTDGIVRSMLLLSRSGAAERVPVDVNRFVHEQATLAYHGARAADADAGVAFERALDPAAGWAEIAEQDLGRVLINLVGNAVQAAAERCRAEPGHTPTVTVRTRREGDAVAVDVADNGPGIPPELQERIFEPFFTTKPAGQGTGLGLSLAADIVSVHGGTLTVASEPGAGATFTLRLPAVDPPA